MKQNGVSATYIFRWQKHLSLRVVPRRQFLLRLHLFQLLPCARSKTFGDFVEPWEKKEATLTRLSRLRIELVVCLVQPSFCNAIKVCVYFQH